MVATLLRPDQVKTLADRVKQSGAIIQLELIHASVDSQADPAPSGNAVGHISSRDIRCSLPVHHSKPAIANTAAETIQAINSTPAPAARITAAASFRTASS
jgi:hypothetical protein